MYPEFSFTRSHLNRLGRRLKRGGAPSDEDLIALAAYQQSLQYALISASVQIADAFAAALPEYHFETTARSKQLRSIVAKLQRVQGSSLATMQDIVGFRLVVPTIVEQEALLSRIPDDGSWHRTDRRQNPSSGYRAVHLVYLHERGPVELQIRSRLQHQWAELSERLERIFPGTKYGEGPDEVHSMLNSLSVLIARLEGLELDHEPEMAPELLAVRSDVMELVERVIHSLQEENKS